jgi:hypothetical protein
VPFVEIDHVLAESRIDGQVDLILEAAILIGGQRFAVDLLAFGIVNGDGNRRIREVGFLVVILGPLDPELEVDLLQLK